MPGIPWAAIGAGLGQGAQAWQQEQQQGLQNLFTMLQLRNAMMQQQQQQYALQAAPGIWNYLEQQGHGGGAGIPSGGGGPTSNVPGVAPGDTYLRGGLLPSGGTYLAGGTAQPFQGAQVPPGGPPGVAPGPMPTTWQTPVSGGGGPGNVPITPSLAPIYQRESSFNPQAQNPTSTASGLGQDINSTWAEAMKALGYGAQFPTAKSAPEPIQNAANIWLQGKYGDKPWAASAPPGGYQPGSGQAPPEATGGPDIFAQIQAQHQQMAQAIDQAMPDAPPEAKLAAFQQLSQMMAPQEKLLSEIMLKSMMTPYQQANLGIRGEEAQGLQAFRGAELGMGQDRLDIEKQRLQEQQAAQGQKGWQFITRPDGSIVRANLGTGEVEPVDLPAGSGRMTPTSGQPASPAEVNFWASVLRNGGSLPPGLGRTAAGANIVRQVMAAVPNAQTTPGGLITSQATTKSNEASLRNMTKMTDAATSFERTANANFDLALRLSKGAVPTDWGPFLNKWIENGETQAGNKTVPPYVTALLTAANEYAKIMSGSTGSQGSTVDARREAAERFSPYLSAGQIEGVISIAKQDMANRKQSLYGQVNDIRGRLQAGGGAPQGAPGGATPAPAGPQNAPTATDPKTGKKVMWNGKAWVPANGSANTAAPAGIRP